MLTTVIPRLVNAVRHLPCLHLISLSSLQSGKRTSDRLATSEVRRRMSENAAATRTPSFQHLWKPGSGYYSDSLGKLTKDSVPVPSPKGVFTIGDYGTCDGSVSLQLMYRIIDHLRNKHGPDLKIQVLYEDQPTNDYNSLFKTIYGNTSHIAKFDNVFPLACGTSFYKQCVPNNTCDIIVSSFATQWLCGKSHVMSSTIFPWQSTSEEELRAYHDASARDWQTFLLLRAAELKQGGLLFVTQPSLNLSSSAQPGEVTDPAGDTWIHLNLKWSELYAGGIITREEFQTCSVPMAVRSLQELKAPFENAATSPVRQAGLNLLMEPDMFLLPCFAKRMWQQKLQRDGADDRNMFAQLLVKAHRVILEPSLRSSLKNTRTSEEQSAIVEQFFETFIQKVVTLNPETFPREYFVGRLVAQKLQFTIDRGFTW